MVTSGPVFSRRLPGQRALNPLAALEQARRQAGDAIVDLTVSNPTVVGLPYPAEQLCQALSPPALARYEPASRGLPFARQAVAADYASRNLAIDPDNVLLTASSSESYALLFKLLCDPGDSVLVPQPSYPLFDYLTALEGVQTLPYRLTYDGGWGLDLDSVSEALAQAGEGGRPRAIVLVSPNNPTGSFTKAGELRRLAALASRHDLALISDEVFAEYPFEDGGAPGADPPRRQAAPESAPVLCAAAAAPGRDVLTFSLGGLSKSCGLPQLKLGWVLAGGPDDLRRAAWDRLEVIADTYLSVATPVQLAAPQLLALGGLIRRQIRARVEANRRTLRAALTRAPAVTLLAAEGGWSAILRVPGVESDEGWAQLLLREEGILVHPGYLFDMPRGTFLVVSLLPEPDLFAHAIERLLVRCSAGMGS